jgi:hypothetical protein
MVKFGEGSLQYELVEGWEQIPDGWSHPDVAGVAADSEGRAYVFGRSDHPLMIYERDGKFLDSWGEGEFTRRTHGIFIDKNDDLYLVDEAVHVIKKYTRDGKQLATMGKEGEPSDTGYDGKIVDHAGPPFNRPTNLAVGPTGELYTSDGYGNARTHRFSTDGKLLQSWGIRARARASSIRPTASGCTPTGACS